MTTIDDDSQGKHDRSPVLNVLITYLSVCAGCNLSVFLPVLAGETLPHFGLTLIFIGALTLLVVILIKLLADIPVVTKVMKRFGEPLMKICYIAIGLYVFWDSGLIEHILGWL